MHEIENGRERRAYGKERRGGEGVDPVLVPQEVEQLRVERRLEVGDLERVVLFTVHTEILDLQDTVNVRKWDAHNEARAPKQSVGEREGRQEPWRWGWSGIRRGPRRGPCSPRGTS
jgi:hypothetical protein